MDYGSPSLDYEHTDAEFESAIKPNLRVSQSPNNNLPNALLTAYPNELLFTTPSE